MKIISNELYNCIPRKEILKRMSYKNLLNISNIEYGMRLEWGDAPKDRLIAFIMRREEKMKQL